jgi:hypothetical protein
MAAAKPIAEVEIFGSNELEFQEAVALVCVKYGGRVTFSAATDDEQTEKTLIASFAKRKVRVAFEHPSGHALEVCQSLGLGPIHPLMICEGFER